MGIRTAVLSDLDALAAIEAACFPAAEAAGRESIARRLEAYPGHFWLLEIGAGEIAAFINGLVTDEPVLRDEMYENAALHNEAGAWQMIFGVDTLPQYRRRGFAAELMEHVIAQAKAQGRKGCVLTCKENLIHYYEKFGYQNEGISRSVHGGACWYDMRLAFPGP